jgi:hypothetical protein
LPSKRFRLLWWKLRCQWVHTATIHTRTFLTIYHRCSVYTGPDRCHDQAAGGLSQSFLWKGWQLQRVPGV